jgi:hypothetical protein
VVAVTNISRIADELEIDKDELAMFVRHHADPDPEAILNFADADDAPDRLGSWIHHVEKGEPDPLVPMFARLQEEER